MQRTLEVQCNSPSQGHANASVIPTEVQTKDDIPSPTQSGPADREVAQENTFVEQIPQTDVAGIGQQRTVHPASSTYHMPLTNVTDEIIHPPHDRREVSPVLTLASEMVPAGSTLVEPQQERPSGTIVQVDAPVSQLPLHPNLQHDMDLWNRNRAYDQNQTEEPFTPVLKNKKTKLKPQPAVQVPYRTRARGGNSSSAQ